jgi:hypothetical protein
MGNARGAFPVRVVRIPVPLLAGRIFSPANHLGFGQQGDEQIRASSPRA